MIKLSKRMKAVSALVTKGNILADIGTDHGYVPISLMKQGKIPSAIAMDINEGPLLKAKEHICQNNLEGKISTRLSDGVAALEPGEAESIVIAGMGGELTLHILKEGELVFRAAKEMILQPQSDIEKVRLYLRNTAYKIIAEDMVFEDGKFYPMMKVVPDSDISYQAKIKPELLKVYDIYGPFLLMDKNPVLKKYLQKEKLQLTDILSKLQKQEKTEAIEERIAQVKQDLHYNESAISILGAD